MSNQGVIVSDVAMEAKEEEDREEDMDVTAVLRTFCNTIATISDTGFASSQSFSCMTSMLSETDKGKKENSKNISTDTHTESHHVVKDATQEQQSQYLKLV